MASVFKRGGKRNRTGKYYISWHDHTGKRRSKCSGTTDKAAAERIAAKLESESALRRENVIDPTLEAISDQSRRTIESHLADYEARMRTAGRTDKHVRTTIGFIRTIAEHAGFQMVCDITSDGVNRYAAELKDKGRSARTIQSHLTAIKGFTKWLTSTHKRTRDSLTSVRKPNPKADRRLERRMLLPEEWQWLRPIAMSGKKRQGMTGPERVLLYEAAIQTGLRSNELRSLTRGRLFLESDRPYITCKARNSKNRKDARQYIRPDLAESLKSYVATKTTKAGIFRMPHEADVAKMLRADLADARTAWIKEASDDSAERIRREESDFLCDSNHDGERFDFHCLRHTCGAWLAMSGIHPKVVQTILRHSTITLTMDTYGHLFRGSEADAVDRLDMFDDLPTALAATGTDDATAEKRKARQSSQDAKWCKVVQTTATTAPNHQAKKKRPSHYELRT